MHIIIIRFASVIRNALLYSVYRYDDQSDKVITVCQHSQNRKWKTRHTQFFPRCSLKKPDNEYGGTAERKKKKKTNVNRLSENVLARTQIGTELPSNGYGRARVAQNEIMKTKRGPTRIIMLQLAAAQTERTPMEIEGEKKEPCKLRLMGKVLRYERAVVYNIIHIEPNSFHH